MINVCGGNLTIEDLEGIEITGPKSAGPRWKGVDHHTLARSVEGALGSRDIQVARSVWSLSNDRQDLFGGFDVTLPDRYGIPEPEGMKYALGIRSSNAQRYAIKMAVGGTVMVCSNGVITGEFVLSKKHTLNLDVNSAVNNGVERWLGDIRNVSGTVDAMKGMFLSSRRKDHLLMEAARRGMMAWGHVGLVDKEYSQPSFKEFEGQNAWSLYNAYTQVMSAPIGAEGSERPRLSPNRQMDGMNGMRSLLLQEAA